MSTLQTSMPQTFKDVPVGTRVEALSRLKNTWDGNFGTVVVYRNQSGIKVLFDNGNIGYYYSEKSLRRLRVIHSPASEQLRQACELLRDLSTELWATDESSQSHYDMAERIDTFLDTLNDPS